VVPVALFLEHVDRDEGIVGNERRLEDRRSARVEEFSRRGDALGAGVVRQVDQHAARIARPSQLAHLAALVEQVLQHLVSGCSSSASGSCTSHHSFLWHWRPEVKRDLERRYGTVVKVAPPPPPKSVCRKPIRPTRSLRQKCRVDGK